MIFVLIRLQYWFPLIASTWCKWFNNRLDYRVITLYAWMSHFIGSTKTPTHQLSFQRISVGSWKTGNIVPVKVTRIILYDWPKIWFDCSVHICETTWTPNGINPCAFMTAVPRESSILRSRHRVVRFTRVEPRTWIWSMMYWLPPCSG